MKKQPRPKLTEIKFDEWAAQIASWIQESVSPFTDDTPEARAERIERARHDRLFFAKTYLPHYFTCEFGAFHQEWDEMADLQNQVAIVIAPREHAKSTFFSCLVPIHDICFKKKNFIVIVSDTNDLATGFVLPVRIELEENQRLIADFGAFRGRVWQQSDFITANNRRMLARGYRDPVRSLKHGPHRPDRIVADDFETDKSVKNPKITKEKKEWLFGTVLGAAGADYSFLQCGNKFAPKSVIAQAAEETDENGVRKYISSVYSCYRNDDESQGAIWEARWTVERLAEKRRQMGSVLFNREMRNRTIVEGSPFREEWLVYTDKKMNYDAVASFLDPSAKSGMANDFKAIVTVGLLRKEMRFDVLSAWIRRATVNDMIDRCYRTVEEYGGFLGVETNMFEDFLREVFDNAARFRGKYLPLREVRHTTQKEGRIISTLSPLAEFGKLRFMKNSDQEILIEQLVYLLDRNVNDDGADALEGAVSLLQQAGEVEYLSVARRSVRLKGAY